MKLLMPFGLGLAIITLAGCGKKADENSYSIAVIPKGTTHEFWKSIHAGAVKAQQELAANGVAVEVIWKGPLREDDRDQQIQVVENFTSRKVSGIVLAPLDSQAARESSRQRHTGRHHCRSDGFRTEVGQLHQLRSDG